MCIDVHTCACAYMSIDTCMYVHTCTLMYIHVCIYLHVHSYTYVRTCTCIDFHTYVHKIVGYAILCVNEFIFTFVSYNII